MKINSHFLLAMHESLTAIRHSGDSKRENFLEKTFRQVVKSGDLRPGKQGEQSPGGTYQERNPSGKERMGKERTGTKGKVNERTENERTGLPRNLLPHTIKYPQQAAPFASLSGIDYQSSSKNSIATVVYKRQAKSSRI